MSDIPGSPADLRALLIACWTPLQACTADQEALCLPLIASTLDDHDHSEASLAGFLGLVRTGTLGQAPQPGNDADAARRLLAWQHGRGEGEPAADDVEFARFEALTQELLRVTKAELDRRRSAG
ncbi:MAG TPA: hypothetical protein VFW26_04360 [Gaiellales bacterium]|nr:hypothetical protein [Gaiellales bacterium]